MNHALDVVQIARSEGAIFRRKDMPGNARQHSAWANWSRCRLRCGLVWAQGSMCCMGVHIGATWRIRLKRPCSAAQWTMH